MKITRSIRLFLFAVIMAAGMGSAFAQMPMAGVPQFVPSSFWNVQQTTLSQVRGLNGIKLPCMMATGYDNGFILRLSGGGQNMLAMAIDFRQSVFKQGRKYSTTIGLDESYVQQAQATAFSDSVLIFNLRKLSGFHQVLRSASNLELAIEGNVMRFGLGNVSQGIDNLEKCYGGDMNFDTPQMPREASVPAVNSESLTRWNEKVTPKPAMMGSATRVSPDNRMLWEARAGESIKNTLEKWARTAGVELEWQAENGGVVAYDLEVRGSFEDAVQSLMAQNATATGIEANMMGSPLGGASQAGYYGQMNDSAPMVSHAMPINEPYNLLPASMDNTASVSRRSAPPMMAGSGMGRWSAPAGSNLQQVLRIWSEQAGVGFNWQSHTGFMVKRAVDANGSYEEALQALLNQYTNDDIRPAAQLNNDPITGQRMLFVESTRI